MDLLPIQQTLQENTQFLNHPDCEPSLSMTVEFFDKIGYNPPWIGYYAQVDGHLVGGCAFKGKPKAGRIEIAYGTFPPYQRQGIGTEMCKQLVQLALRTDSAVKVTARTFDAENYSTRILQKNGFDCLGIVWDDEDGDVLEWEYKGVQ